MGCEPHGCSPFGSEASLGFVGSDVEGRCLQAPILGRPAASTPDVALSHLITRSSVDSSRRQRPRKC